MARISVILAVALFCLLTAQAPNPRVRAAIAAAGPHVHQAVGDADGSFYCPMDPDIRRILPGRCPRCGMTLVEGAPDIVEYGFNLGVEPPVPMPGETTRLIFGVRDPRSGEPVHRFEIVHEQLYHVFLVSQDLSFFLHTHPERTNDEDFHLDVRLPKPGMYRVLSDFYPAGGTPQLITSTVVVPGANLAVATPSRGGDLAPKKTENADTALQLTPARPIARQPVSLTLQVSPAEGVQLYLGAWGHLLAASADLIDMIHGHPVAAADSRGEKDIQFDVVFPRGGVYRVWIQFQRLGRVNTVAFDIPVDEPAR